MLEGGDLGHGDHGALAGGVGDVAGRADGPVDGGDVDDRAAAVAAQRGDGGAHAVEDAGRVDGHRGVPSVVGLVDDRCDADDAGVVDEDVELPEARPLLDGRVPVLGGGDVEAQEVDVVAGGAELAGVRLACVLEDVAEDDGGAFLGEAPAVCCALSAGAAGDERRLACEPRVIRGSPGSRAVRLRRVGRVPARAGGCARSAAACGRMSRVHSWRGMSMRDSGRDERARTADSGDGRALLGGQELRDQARLGGVDGKLRATRGGEADEVQALEPDREGHAADAQRDAVGRLEQGRVQERKRRLEAGRVDDGVDRAHAAVGEVHVVAVQARDARARRGRGRGG